MFLDVDFESLAIVCIVRWVSRLVGHPFTKEKLV